MSTAARPIITEHERFRRLRGYSITALAREIGFSRPYTSRVEGGVQKPSARYRAAVAKVLRVPEDVIFGGRLQRLGETSEFANELQRLAELAPDPWGTELRALLEQSGQ